MDICGSLQRKHNRSGFKSSPGHKVTKDFKVTKFAENYCENLATNTKTRVVIFQKEEVWLHQANIHEGRFLV